MNDGVSQCAVWTSVALSYTRAPVPTNVLNLSSNRQLKMVASCELFPRIHRRRCQPRKETGATSPPVLGELKLDMCVRADQAGSHELMPLCLNRLQFRLNKGCKIWMDGQTTGLSI